MTDKIDHDIARICTTLADAPQDEKIMVMALRDAAAEIERLRDLSLGRTLEMIMEAAENGDADACHEAARRALRDHDLMQTISKG